MTKVYINKLIKILKAFMTADVRLGSKYVSEVLLDLKGQCFLSWKEKSQKKENMKGKGIAMPFPYGSFSDSFFFFFDSLD